MKESERETLSSGCAGERGTSGRTESNHLNVSLLHCSLETIGLQEEVTIGRLNPIGK